MAKDFVIQAVQMGFKPQSVHPSYIEDAAFNYLINLAKSAGGGGVGESPPKPKPRTSAKPVRKSKFPRKPKFQ